MDMGDTVEMGGTVMAAMAVVMETDMAWVQVKKL